VAKIAVKAPSTIANLGPGFDVFGISLDKPFDIVRIEEIDKRQLIIEVKGPYGKGISNDPDENSAGLAATSFLNFSSISSGLRIIVEKQIPPGMGLGSSGASAAAVAYALNELFSTNLDEERLIGIAAHGEKASSGVEHADNVAPAIKGGFVIIKSYTPLEVISLRSPQDLIFCICMPKIQVEPGKTGIARGLIPIAIDMKNVTSNIGNASTLAVGFAIGDSRMIGSGMSDSIVEPARARMIPGYNEVRKLALQAGALGVAICGAGPSMLAITNSANNVKQITDAMSAGFSKGGVESESFVAGPGKGVEQISWN